jgi:hypothetical protein
MRLPRVAVGLVWLFRQQQFFALL